MPDYTIIAGPNGAGKSTFSADLSAPAALIFDPDQIKLQIDTLYPGISHDALESAVQNSYLETELVALSQNKPLTVETNLRNSYLGERAAFFKAQGWKTNLIFMMLPDIAASMDRVNLRVKRNGHFVDPESIRSNFSYGLKNLQKVAPRVDNVMLICAAATYGFKFKPQVLLSIHSGELVYQKSQLPRWTKPLVTEVRDLLFMPGLAEDLSWNEQNPSQGRSHKPGR